jgi:hypothetical protein
MYLQLKVSHLLGVVAHACNPSYLEGLAHIRRFWASPERGARYKTQSEK